MRKVKALCVYKDNRVYNLTAMLKDSNVTLIHYDLGDDHITPYHHETFDGLYRDVLGVLKSNDMYCGHYKDFNRVWYDISFIDLNDPTVVSKYSVSEK